MNVMTSVSALVLAAALAHPAAACTDAPRTLLDLRGSILHWENAIPIGNGACGGLVWGNGEYLLFSLDRGDWWHPGPNTMLEDPAFNWTNFIAYTKRPVEERRKVFERRENDPFKLPGARIGLVMKKGARVLGFTLEAETGAAGISVRTPAGEVRRLYAWFEDGDDMMSLAVPADVEFRHIYNGTLFRFQSLRKGYENGTFTKGEKEIRLVRKHPEKGKHPFAVDFTAGIRLLPGSARPKTKYFADFWKESSVSVPDRKMQRLYDLAMHCYAAGSRKGSPPIALEGVWSCDNGSLPAWSGDYHHDLNTQMTYLPAPVAGHFDANDSFTHWMINLRPNFEKWATRFFGMEKGCIAIPSVMGIDGTYIGGWAPFQLPPTGSMWAFRIMYDGWLYNPSPERLDAIWDFALALAKGAETIPLPPGPDGIRRLPISMSPEIGANSNVAFMPPNTTNDRSVWRNFFRQVSELAAAKGEKALACRYAEFAESFGPPVVDDRRRYLLAKGVLPRSHRHLSHMMDIFPYRTYEEDGVDAAGTIDFFERQGRDAWLGFTYPWMAALNARIGRGDESIHYLDVFAEAFVSRNGFHMNNDFKLMDLYPGGAPIFTLEANFGYASAVQQMLLDATRREIRVFPALPSVWKGLPVSFKTLRVPGGHSVSASRTADGLINVRIDPFSDCAVSVSVPGGRKEKVSLRSGVPWIRTYR